MLYSDESYNGDGGSLAVSQAKTFVERVPEKAYVLNVPETREY